MKLLLSSNECFISFIVKRNVSKDSSSHKGTNLFHLNEKIDTEGSIVIVVVGGVRVTMGVFICCR